MNIDSFLEHYGITENPFRAEEAKDDPIFKRMMADGTSPHPDFQKVLGEVSQPNSAVVFGEKGSGKTAFRLLMQERIRAYNEQNPENQVWSVSYDNLNPVLDRYTHHSESEDDLSGFRLEDHMDAILSLATTKLVNKILKTGGEEPFTRKQRKRFRNLSRLQRVDLGELAALYDQPQGGNLLSRWRRIRRRLRLGSVIPVDPALSVISLLSLGGALTTAAMIWWMKVENNWLIPGLLASGIICILSLYVLLRRRARVNKLAKNIQQDVKVVERTTNQLRHMLDDLPSKDLAAQPVPKPGDQDSRYQLIGRLTQILHRIGYDSTTVLLDCVDEPAMVNGDTKKMQAIVWPLLNNKFLQQSGFGVKMLLPIELRHQLHREHGEFFQQARLDKQNMVDRLAWTGSTLYDLCTKRLQACTPKGSPVKLTDLFSEDINQQDLITALDQMQQPRDALKFMYQLIQEHCLNTPDENADFDIDKNTLEYIKKRQAQRLNELQRGLAPA